MDNQPLGSAKQELADRLKSANNILVTVSRNPSVDQLSACIGLALLLNKQGKHTAAVFSGQVPSTLEFLKPEETLEKNTDSLRDFIISLDKTKADKLRYKVEDDVVRIFITPYKTSLSQEDFDFSQGDFNIDLVVALGVNQQEDLDEAITAHGRILHDATVASITTSQEGNLGSINWQDPGASSLSELVTELSQLMNMELDNQVATALLTGIVAETDRFGNDKTSPGTMSASAALMSAGANQQLVASQLETPEQADNAPAEGEAGSEEENGDGAITIDHSNDQPPADESDVPFELPTPTTSGPADQPEPELSAEPSPEPEPEHPHRIVEPPTLGGTLTANNGEEKLDPVTDPLSMPNSEPPQLLERKPIDNPVPAPSFTPPPSDFSPPPAADPVSQPPPEPQTPPEPPVDPSASTGGGPTLADIEKEVKQENEQAAPPEPPADLNDARDEVNKALAGSAPAAAPTEPIQALNAQPLGDDLHPQAPSLEEQIPGLTTPADSPADTPADKPEVKDPNAPPPVPPPLLPTQNGSQQSQ